MKSWIRSRNLIRSGNFFIFETVDYSTIEKFDECLKTLGGTLISVEPVKKIWIGNRKRVLYRAKVSLHSQSHKLQQYWIKYGSFHTVFDERLKQEADLDTKNINVYQDDDTDSLNEALKDFVAMMLKEVVAPEASVSVESVATRITNEAYRTCKASARIQESGEINAWQHSLAEDRAQKCLLYYAAGSRQGRVNLLSHLNVLVSYHLGTEIELENNSKAQTSLLEDFLQSFYVETIKTFRHENHLTPDYTPRTRLELAEYMAFTEQYAKRRLTLSNDNSQQLIVLRAQEFTRSDSLSSSNSSETSLAKDSERKGANTFFEKQKSLSCIEIIKGDLLEIEADVIVRPTSTRCDFAGNLSKQVVERVDIEIIRPLQDRSEMELGEVIVTKANPLPARYIFHAAMHDEGLGDLSRIIDGVNSSLKQAESLDDVKSIAFPSVGTGAAQLNPSKLAPRILNSVLDYLEQHKKLEKVLFVCSGELAYQSYIFAYQTLVDNLEATSNETEEYLGVIFEVSEQPISIGEKLDVSVAVMPVSDLNGGDNYVCLISENEAVGEDLNVIIATQDFLTDNPNVFSLPIFSHLGEVGKGQENSTHLSLTALRPGLSAITAEIYVGEIFKVEYAFNVEIIDLNRESIIPQIKKLAPRPVPRPNVILQVQKVSHATALSYSLCFQLKSSLWDEEINCSSQEFSNNWIEKNQELLANTLERLTDACPQDAHAHLTSLGYYLFNQVLPTEIQDEFNNLLRLNRNIAVLILSDFQSWIPWEILHNGHCFLSEKLSLGHGLWESHNSCPYEFPVGAINLNYSANASYPENWRDLLEPPNAPNSNFLPDDVLRDLSTYGALRGLHLLRYEQSDTANRQDAPVALCDENSEQNLNQQIRPAKLNLRRNRPLVSLSHVRDNLPKLTNLDQAWASIFLRSGASAFIGPHWSVAVPADVSFVSALYNRLWLGNSLGEAFQTARKISRIAHSDSIDWLSYCLFGDPMARPYKPVKGNGYAVVEPIGQDIKDPLFANNPLRFRLSLRRTPPIWHEERVIEVAEDLTFEDLQVHVATFGLEVTPPTVTMSRTPNGNHLGWFTLTAPDTMAGESSLVQVYFSDGMEPIHSVTFSLQIAPSEVTV